MDPRTESIPTADSDCELLAQCFRGSPLSFAQSADFWEIARSIEKDVSIAHDFQVEAYSFIHRTGFDVTGLELKFTFICKGYWLPWPLSTPFGRERSRDSWR